MSNQRNDLIPTVITDKNGKLTTVHKRQAPAAGSSAITSPPPNPYSKSNPLTPTSIGLTRVTRELNAAMDSAQLSDQEYEALLSDLHPDSLQRYADLNIATINTEGVYIAIKWGIENRSFAALNSLLLLAEELPYKNIYWQEQSLNALQGINYVARGLMGGTDIDLTDNDDPRVPGARALFKALGIAENRMSYIKTLQEIDGKDQRGELFKELDINVLIMKHPERAQEIMQAYTTRGEYDAQFYTEMISSGIPTLTEGML